MSTVQAIPMSLREHVVLDEISWETYEALLNDLQEQPIRLTYDNGRLEIMPPLSIHEVWKQHFTVMITLLGYQRKIRIKSLGSTTFRRQDLAQGVEPDVCFYVKHAPQIVRKKSIDLAIDPPPDLAIEVDITSHSIPRHPIYAALGVPELWRFDGSNLFVLRRANKRTCRTVTKSEVFPFLPIDQFKSYLLRMDGEDEMEVAEEYQSWLRSL